ncbi:hypothetical protein ABZ806_44005 [Spirillospora sp. NPDC047418]
MDAASGAPLHVPTNCDLERSYGGTALGRTASRICPNMTPREIRRLRQGGKSFMLRLSAMHLPEMR